MNKLCLSAVRFAHPYKFGVQITLLQHVMHTWNAPQLHNVDQKCIYVREKCCKTQFSAQKCIDCSESCAVAHYLPKSSRLQKVSGTAMSLQLLNAHVATNEYAHGRRTLHLLSSVRIRKMYFCHDLNRL